MLFFDPHAIGFERYTILISSKVDGQIVLLAKFCMFRRAIGRKTDDANADLVELRLQQRESNRFLGAAGRVVFRIEVDDSRLAFERRQEISPLSEGRVKSGAGSPTWG